MTLTTRGTFVDYSVRHVEDICGNSRYHNVLIKFPNIISPLRFIRDIRHATLHNIKTAPGQPVHCCARQLASDRQQIARSMFEAMICDGIVCRSENFWTSSHHLALKKNNIWCPCGDYRALNA